MTSQDKPLHAAHEKIRRARHKFEYLKGGIRKYIASQPHSVRIERDEDFNYVVARLDKDLPDDFAFEVVEAVGHLRSALDKTIVEVVERNHRGVSGVGYPFGGMTNGVPSAFPDPRIENGVRKKLTKDQWDLIEGQKPFPGGNDILWSVNEVANTDKHRKGLVQIHPSLSNGVGIGSNGPGWSIGGTTLIGPTDRDYILRDPEREQVLLADDGRGFNQRIDCTISEAVVFGDLLPLTGKNVLTTLNQQIRLVEGIVKAFRSLCF